MIGILGISHKTASQDIREQFAFTKEEILCFSEVIQQETDITEIVIVSTCNRTEIYYFYDKLFNHKNNKRLIEILLNYKKVESVDEDMFYKYHGMDAIKHLFSVTSGVDSVVIGEDQIVGQVKEAYLFCTEAALTEAVLMRLFQKSFEAAKRTRTETLIQQGPTSMSYVAVDLCSKIHANLSDKTVLVVGSGETGNLALHNLKKRGVTKLIISNRTFEKAVSLANEYGGEAVDFNVFHEYIAQSDIVIVATGAQNILISKENVQASMDLRNNSPQLYIDLSVPRNVDKSIETIDQVKLFGVDDLQEVLDNTTEKRVQSIEQAHQIIEEVAQEYMEWFEARAIRPIIKTIATNMQELCAREVAAYKIANGNKNSELIEEYANKLTLKFMSSFIKNLKEISKTNTSSHALNSINDIFVFDKK